MQRQLAAKYCLRKARIFSMSSADDLPVQIFDLNPGAKLRRIHDRVAERFALRVVQPPFSLYGAYCTKIDSRLPRRRRCPDRSARGRRCPCRAGARTRRISHRRSRARRVERG